MFRILIACLLFFAPDAQARRHRRPRVVTSVITCPEGRFLSTRNDQARNMIAECRLEENPWSEERGSPFVQITCPVGQVGYLRTIFPGKSGQLYCR